MADLFPERDLRWPEEAEVDGPECRPRKGFYCPYPVAVAVLSFILTMLLSCFVARPHFSGVPERIVESLTMLGLVLCGLQLVGCVLTLILAFTAVFSWSGVADRFYAIGRLFLASIAGTVIALGMMFLIFVTPKLW